MKNTVPDKSNAILAHLLKHSSVVLLWLAAALLAGCEDDGSLRYPDPDTMRIIANSAGMLLNSDAAVLVKDCDQGEGHLFYPLGRSADLTCNELQAQSFGLQYRGFLFSSGRADTLVIYHEGHLACVGQPWLSNTMRPDALGLLAALLDYGDVLYLDMPGMGTNCGQQLVTAEGLESITDHAVIGKVDRPRSSALAYFFDHIGMMLDELAPEYATIHMVGRSGGGWVTTLYAALDRRVARSVSVAGTLPLDLRLPRAEDARNDTGDWEQSEAYLYTILDYYDFYQSAGHNYLVPRVFNTPPPAAPRRRHVQIYNEFDSCCFSGVKGGLAAQRFFERYPYSSSTQFIVIQGEYEHTIWSDVVLSQLFDDELIATLTGCRELLLQDSHQELTCPAH